MRQSLDRTGEAAAVDRQEAACRELAAEHGWTVARVYADNDRSATKGPRPAYTEMLADLRAGRCDVVLVWHPDRLYRRLRDLVDLVEIAEARALRIAAVKAADIDLTTPAGRMIASMIGSASRYEGEQKAARQKAANRQRAQAGAAAWTRRPFGFDRDGRTAVVVEDEARAIRETADALIAGETVAAIIRRLDAEGVPTSTGARWSPTTLRRVMTKPRLIGRVIYNGEDMGAHGPAILDEETFDRVGSILTDPGRRRAASTTVRHLMSGLLVCSACETPMHSGRPGKHLAYVCKTCKRTRRLSHVDEVVEAVVLARLSQPDAARLLGDDVDLVAERARAAELRERRDGIADLLAEGLLGRDAAKARARDLTRQIEEHEGRILAASQSSPLAGLVDADDVEAAWRAAPLTQRRRVIRALLEARCEAAGKGVRFTPDQITIQWKA
ncbi:recombinase family protein [Janibacter massiliensis]|uniref:recombinase family protein n=1 Tax=Janibacter massiliensis TaxID=2058291 RepID=UPI001F1E0CF0|nr:recombinase family protein [Janibacter massiliensis]